MVVGKCRNPKCGNLARYARKAGQLPDLCGVCDIVIRAGAGVLIRGFAG